MKLTDEEIQKVESFLKKKVAAKCPVCLTGEWDAKQSYSFQLLSIDDETKSLSGEKSVRANLVACVCLNCSHVALFSFDAIMNE